MNTHVVFCLFSKGKFYRCTDEAKSSPVECKLVSLILILNDKIFAFFSLHIEICVQCVVFLQGHLYPV